MAQIRSKPFGVTKQGANVTEYILSNPAHAEGGILDAVCIAAHERAAAGAAGRREVILIICHGAVSYTHLDVYKRQSLSITKATRAM